MEARSWLVGVQKPVEVTASPSGTAPRVKLCAWRGMSLECTVPRPVLQLDLRSVFLDLLGSYARLCVDLERGYTDEYSGHRADVGQEASRSAFPSGTETPSALAGHHSEPGALDWVVFLFSMFCSLFGRLPYLDCGFSVTNRRAGLCHGSIERRYNPRAC